MLGEVLQVACFAISGTDGVRGAQIVHSFLKFGVVFFSSRASDLLIKLVLHSGLWGSMYRSVLLHTTC